MFEQVFKSLDEVLWKESGCSGELDYAEQASWLLFLKYLDDLEGTRQLEASLEGKIYYPILSEEFRWATWAAPKNASGELDHNKALTGPDLIDFVNTELIPYLRTFKERAESSDTIEYKIGGVFSEIGNKFQSGYALRDALDLVDSLHFRSQDQKFQLSALYEEKIKRMGNAGRNGGEYYTPRTLIRNIVRIIDPQIGESVYDGACGSAGFLCEVYDYLRSTDLNADQLTTLQKKTLYGKEKKSLAYIIGVMNLILHGVEAPNIIHANTLADHDQDVQDKDRYDIILANPPFGGKERKEVQQNFPVKTGETAFLFLQHFIRMLRAGGRAAVVIKNTFLSNSDNASVALRKELLASCNLHTVLGCPGGTFQGAGVKTVVLFFEKGVPTRKIWFYQLTEEKLGRRLGKTKPLNDDDLSEFVELQKTFADSQYSWSVDASTVDEATCDMSVSNPNKEAETELRDPEVILDEIAALDEETEGILSEIRKLGVG